MSLQPRNFICNICKSVCSHRGEACLSHDETALHSLAPTAMTEINVKRMSVAALILGLGLAAPASASSFNFELNASTSASSLSIEPGFAFGSKISVFDLWVSGEYFLQTDLENDDVEGGLYKSDSLLLKGGYDWYVEENMAITPYVGLAMTFDDVEFDATSGRTGFLYESGATQIFGGFNVTLKMSDYFLFTAGAAFLPGYDLDESQTLLSFTLTWRPFAGFGREPTPQRQVDTGPVDSSPMIDDSSEPDLSEPSPSFDDIASLDDEPPAEDAFIEIETFDEPVTDPAPAPEPIRKATPPPQPPVIQRGAASDTISGIRIIPASEVNFKYGIQMGWMPSKSATGAFIKNARSKVDVSAMFITRAKDGFRIYYEGFNDFQAAKKILKQIRGSFSDAFIKKLK